MIYLCTKFHMSSDSGSLVIAIKAKVIRFYATAILFHYRLQNVTLT
jgi:hypothetical protein